MKRKRIFFLTLNYIQIILCLFLIGWLFGHQRKELLDEDYIGLIVFSVFIIFIANSLVNIFSAKASSNEISSNRTLAVFTFILTLLFILSVGLAVIISTIGVYTSLIDKRSGLRFNIAAIIAVLLSIISLFVLVTQYYFKQHLKKANKIKMESQIDIIGLEPSNHE